MTWLRRYSESQNIDPLIQYDFSIGLIHCMQPAKHAYFPVAMAFIRTLLQSPHNNNNSPTFSPTVATAGRTVAARSYFRGAICSSAYIRTMQVLSPRHKLQAVCLHARI